MFLTIRQDELKPFSGQQIYRLIESRTETSTTRRWWWNTGVGWVVFIHFSYTT